MKLRRKGRFRQLSTTGMRWSKHRRLSIRMKLGKVYEYSDLVKLHRKRFGFEPVITGINFWSSDKIPERIIRAIETGIPYIEDPVPAGVLI